jgi:hypothetical protein
MKQQILNHEFATSSNGNTYCKLEVKPANDEWAASFNYVMFVTDAMKENLEKNFPKFIYLEEVRVKTPEPFNRVWMSDGNGYSEGDLVSRINRVTGEVTPVVFDDIKVVIRTLPTGEPARGEDAEKLMLSAWNRGINDGSIIPLSQNNIADLELSTGDDMFAGAESVGDEIPVETTETPAQPAQSVQGNQVIPGIQRPARPVRR